MMPTAQKTADLKTASSVSTGRILSVDALRGFDMFWIIGGTLLFPALDNIFHSPVTAWFSTQSEHSAWDHPHLLDLIFPLFLFIVGLVLPVSLNRLKSRTASWSAIYIHVFKRFLILFILGLLAKGLLLNFAFKPGVLSRIGFAYLAAAILVLHTSPRFQIIFNAVLLVAGAMAMTFIPIPALNGSIYINKDISTAMPVTAESARWLLSVSSTLFGVHLGHYLLSVPTFRKALVFAASGIGCVVVALVVRPFVPWIFYLWTSSFVLFTAGISMVLFAIFYWIIDVSGFRRWSFFFVVIGANAILIYFLTVARLVDFQRIADFFILAPATHCGAAKDLLRVAAMLATEWLMLFFLFKNKLFLKA
jgi:predicted acyltransferase